LVMDERTRALLQQSYDLLERVDRTLAESASEPRAEVTWTPPPVRRQPADEVHYKTTVQPEAPQMDRATQARWDAWANGIVQAKLEAFASILGEEAGQMEKRFNAELKRLTDEIEALREDVRAASAKNVTPLRSHVA
jgi:hypothetical protein